MSDLCRLIWCALIGLFRPRAALEAEVLVLRHQLNVLRRKCPKRLVFGNVDRLVFAALYRAAPGVLDALKILKPQTVIRWHRAGFRTYWRWKSRPRGGRPKIGADIRQLIRDSAPSAQFIPEILQRSSHTPIAAQGRAHSAFRSDCGPHACDASSGRTASPIFPRVGFRQGQVPFAGWR